MPAPNPPFRVRDCASAAKHPVDSLEVYVVEDLFEDPLEVRRAALGASYRSPGKGSFPGLMAPIREGTEEIQDFVARSVPFDFAAHRKSFSFCRVTTPQRELGRGQTTPHFDSPWPEDLAGVVYLNLPEDCRGGTGFYRHRRSGLAHFPDRAGSIELVRRFGLGKFADLDPFFLDPAGLPQEHPCGSNPSWELLRLVEMRFNRLVFYPSRLFHAPCLREGDFDKRTGCESVPKNRLTLTFFFDLGWKG